MEKEQTEDMGYFEEVTNINCKKMMKLLMIVI